MPIQDLGPVDLKLKDIGPAETPTPITVPPVDASLAQRTKKVYDYDESVGPLAGTPISRGISTGILQVGEGLAGFGETLADLVGADSAKAWLKDRGDSLSEMARAIPTAVEDFTQIRDARTLGAYTAFSIGKLVPQMALSFGAGGLAARGAATAGQALLRGTLAAGATSYAQETGGIYRGIRDETGVEAPKTALAFGLPAAALDVLTPARFLGKVFDGAADEIKSKAWGSLVRRSFVEAAKSAPIEGLTESAQESIAISANKFADSTYDAINGRNFIRVLDAGLQGILGGALVGGATPFVAGKAREETGGIDDTPPILVEKLTDAPFAVPTSPPRAYPPEAPPQPTAEVQVQELRQAVPPADMRTDVPSNRAVPPADIEQPVTAAEPAPVVPPPVTPEPTPAPRPPPTGPSWQAQTPGGEVTVSGVWRVSSARKLVTSFDTGYDSTLQPRDRSRIASHEQIASIATQLDVNRLGESPTTNLGSPLSDARRQILSGNGRVTALRSLYDAGGRAADEYRSFVRQRAADLGLNAEEVSAIQDPVLHREVADYGGTDPVRLSNLSNQSDVMGMSAGEKAVSDARTLERTPALVDLFRPSEDGDVLAASNREFLNRFIQATGDQAVLLSAEGYNGPVLTKRVRGAMAGLLIGAEDLMLMRNLLEEAEDTGIKRVADAVIASVPLLMRLRGTAYDLGPAISQALRDLVSVRKSGERLEEFLGQSLMFADPQRSMLSDKLLRLMHSGKSVKALLGVFERYSTLAREAVADQSSGGLFTGDVPRTREQLLQAVYERTNQNPKADQADFTFRQPQTLQATDAVASGHTPEGDRPAAPLASMGPGWTSVDAGLSLSVQQVQSSIAALATLHGVSVEVVPRPPVELGPRFKNARGYVYPDGRVQLYALNIQPGFDPNELFYHEVAVHLGLQVAATTPAEKAELAVILNSVAPRIMAKADAISRRGGFSDFKAIAGRYGFDMATPEGRQGAVAELLGREAQRYAAMKTPPGWWRQLIGKLKAWLGRIFRFDIGDDGVYAIITKGLSRAGRAQRTVKDSLTVQPPLASLAPTLKSADLEKTIAFTPDPATQTTEAIMASGQTTGLLGVLRDHIANLANQFIPAGLTPSEQQRRMARAASVVNVTRLEGIENVAQTLGVTPQQFDAAYQAMPDAGMKTLLAKHWFDQFNLIERNARRTAAARQEAADKVASPGFQQKLRNLRVQINRRDVAEQARRLIVAQLKNGLDQARARIGQQGVNETMQATANEQIRMFSELLQRVDPIQRRMWDIIIAVDNNQALFEGLADGTFETAEDFLNAYLVTNPALPGPGPEMVELRVAADILHRTRSLALRMTAAVASEDAAVNQAVIDLEGRIRHSVDAGSYRTVINNVLRRVVSYASKEGKAAAIVRITQKPLFRQIELLESLEFGEAVFGATLADPRYRTMRNRANELVGAFPRPAHALKEKGEPLTPLSSPFLPEHTVYLPDGTTATFRMYSRKADWDAQRQGIDDALAALTAWLAANPATDPAHDIYRSFYEWEFDTLNTLWHASFAFDSPKIFPAFRNFHFKMVDSMLKMFDSLADSIGTRDLNLAKSLAGILKDVMHQMSDWSSKNSNAITHTMYLAIMSHQDIARGNTLAGAARTWYREVLNPIFASLRNPGKPGYRTGDIIASSGHRITRQDMEAARRQARSTADAMAINVARDRLNYATPPLVEDRIIPGAPALRRVLTLSPMMVPRRFGADGRSVASQFIASVILGNMTPQDFWRDLNRFQHVKSMVEDRSEEYSTVSPLQLEDAFRAAKTELQKDPSEIDDIQSLAAFMAQHTTATPDEIEAFIGSEMTRSVNAFINAIPDLQQQKRVGPVPEFDIKSWEQANAFTLGRGKALAPPSFYEYGFKDTAGILNFATSGNSFYMDQFVQSLREIAAKMRTYRDTTIKERTDELVRTMGETKGTEMVRSENRDNIRLGTETLLWEKVDEYANSLDGFVKTFNENYTVGGKETETQVRSADNMLSRLVGGILSGIVGTVRNAIDGGFYHNGVRLSRLESSTVRAFPRAAYHVLRTTIPLMGRTTMAGLKGVGTVFGQVPSALMTLARTGNFLKFEGQLLGKAVDDIADSMFGIRELNQQLRNRGLAIHVTPSETVENIADFWRSSGVNREVQMSGNPFARAMQTVGQAIGAAVDVQLALFAKPFFPRVGDLIANEAVSGATLGALKNFEKRFRILADTFRQMGITGAALANRQFTAREVFGSFPGMGTTAEDLRLLEQWFVESNVDFHRSLADWFRRLETDPSAQWLTNEEKWRLAIRSVEVVNAATPFNRPLALRDNFLTRMIGLVLGWNIHAYRQQATYIGQSADNPNSQFRIRTAIALWMLVILAVADASNEGTELLVRMITRLMGDPERSTRLPHEFEATSDQLKSHLVYAFNSVPFVASAINAAFNDQPTKAGFSPYLLIQNKTVDLINYVGGVINSGDITYRLAPTIKGFVPLPGLAVALNQLPEIAGQKPAVDVTRLMTRYGEKELLARPFIRSGPGASANVTPLSPYGDRLIAAVISGDTEKADRLYGEAIQIATRLGKRDPEASVRGMLISRLPISRAFKTTPTPGQYSALLGRMTADQRDRVNDFNQRATIGLARLGVETNKIYPMATARTTSSTRGRTASNRLYRPARISRVRMGGRSRSRLGTRRRRNSLVRQAV